MSEQKVKYKVNSNIENENYNLMKEYVDLVDSYGGYVAGGCFKDELVGKMSRDIDVYFRTEEGLNKTKGMFEEDKGRFEFIFSNENVYSYWDNKNERVLELNMRDIGKPEHVVQVFDFTVVKAAFYKEEGQYNFLYHEDFFKHNKEKVLEIDEEDMLNPLRTFNRLIKYVSYGYMPTAYTKEFLVRRINEVKLAEARIYNDTDGEDYLWYTEDTESNRNSMYPMLIEVSYSQKYIDNKIHSSYETVVDSPEAIQSIENRLYSDPLVYSVTWGVVE